MAIFAIYACLNYQLISDDDLSICMLYILRSSFGD